LITAVVMKNIREVEASLTYSLGYNVHTDTHISFS